MKTTNLKPLRMALSANAVFSLACAALMIAAPAQVGAWLGVQAPFILQVVGACLVLFAFDLMHQATRRRMATWRALYASVADFVWVIGTFVLLALFPGVLSTHGAALVVVIALAVLGFGGWQVWAMGQAHKLPNGDLYRHCILVATDAPADAMWRVLARIGDIQRYMPALRSSRVRDGVQPGVGAVRECQDRAGKRWAEECIAFREGEGFDVRFLTDAEDFPFPAETMHGGWKLMSDGPQGSTVMVWWELVPKPKWLAPILLPVLAFQADRDFPKVVGRMAADAMGHDVTGKSRGKAGWVARLIPNFC